MTFIEKTEIEKIEKFFDIKFLGSSRIDGNPIFKNEKCDLIMNNLKNFFEIEIINYFNANFQLLHNKNQLPEDFIIKIVTKKKDFNQYIRKEKLKKLNQFSITDCG